MQPSGGRPIRPQPIQISPDSRRLRGIWTLLLVLLLAFLSVRCVRFGAALLRDPYPVEPREFAQVRSTWALAEGANPWSPDRAVADANSYGILYPWVASKLLPAGHRGLRAHRALSLAALLAGAAGLFAAGLGLGAGVLAAWGAALAWLGGCLFFVTPTARCDAFAAAFFLAAVLAARPRAPAGRIAAGLALAVLGYHAKAYVGIAGPLIVLGLALEGRRRAALAAALAWSAAQLLSMAAVQAAYPGYLQVTLLAHARSTQSSWVYLLLQDRDYLVHAGLPWLLLLGLAARRGALRWGTLAPAAAVLLLLQLLLGRHVGANLEYYFHLLQPLLVLACLETLPALSGRAAGACLAAAAAALSVQYGTARLDALRTVDLAAWRAAEARLAAADDPFAAAAFSSILSGQGKTVWDNGQTEYLPAAGGAVAAAALAWRDRGRRGLLEGRFDLLAIPERWHVEAAAFPRYREEASWTLDLPVEMERRERYRVFVPRAAPRGRRP